LGEVPGRFLAAANGLGDFPEALALAGEHAQLARLVGLPRLLVAFEKLLGHQLAFFFAVGFFAGPFFLAGAFLRPFFVAGPLAARASIRAMACSSVTSSGFMSRGIVALVVP